MMTTSNYEIAFILTSTRHPSSPETHFDKDLQLSNVPVFMPGAGQVRTEIYIIRLQTAIVSF